MEAKMTTDETKAVKTTGSRAGTNSKKYELLLAAVISARATSFMFSKIILRDMEPFNLMAVRFLIAFVMLAILFRRKLLGMTKKVFWSGITVGVLFFAVMLCEMLALEQADSSLVSLLENCAILFVPVLEAVLFRKVPGRVTAASIVTAMTGVFLLAAEQGELKGGFTLGLLAGICYAVAIIVTARLTHESESALSIGILQVGTMGALSLVCTILFEQPHLPGTGEQWLMMALLVVVCTGFGFTLQPVAQSHVSAATAGLLCALSPAIAALLGVTALHERLGVTGAAGLVLILGSIALPHVLTWNHEKSPVKKDNVNRKTEG